MITRESSIPVYHQIYKIMQSNIENQIYDENTKLPSERDLAASFSVTRDTIRKSLKKLIEKGYIYTVKGQGNFVKKREYFNYKVSKSNDFTGNIMSIGQNPVTKLIDMKRITPSKSQREMFKLEEDEKLWVVFRIRYANKTPISLTRSFIPCKFAEDLENYIGKLPSITETLKEFYKYSPQKDSTAIEVRMPKKEDMEYLNIEPTIPLINVTSLIKFPGGTPLELCTTNFRSDKIKLNIKLN